MSQAVEISPQQELKAKWITELVDAGFAIMPLIENTKVPYTKRWQMLEADPTALSSDFPNNYGVIGKSHFLVIDVDSRNFKNGNDSLLKLLSDIGLDSLSTFTVKTGGNSATGGGLHFYLKKPPEIKLRCKLDDYPGIEIKSKGAFLVGPGSIHPDTGRQYEVINGKPDSLLDAPSKLLELFAYKERTRSASLNNAVDDEATRARFQNYLSTAELAVEGGGGDLQTFNTACQGRDFGLTEEATLDEMLENWNDRCSPPWHPEELAQKVANAYRYAKGPLGSKHPSSDFGKFQNKLAMAFPLDALPVTFQNFAIAAQKSLQCPIDYVGSALLAVAAIVIGGKVRIQVKPRWHEYPNLFMALVGTPAAKKSPALKLCFEVIEGLEKGLYAVYQDAMDRYEIQMAKYQAAQEAWKKAKVGNDPPLEPKKPILKRILARDITFEALCEQLANNAHGIGLIYDELATWIRSQNQYRSKGNGSDRSQFLSLWSNTQMTVDRKGKEPLFIPAPCVTLIGGIQPDILLEIRKNSSMNDGMAERILFCCPPRCLDLPNEGFDIPPEIQGAFTACIHQIYNKRPDSLKTLVLSPEAKTRFVVAEREWALATQAEDFPKEMEAFYVKIASYLGRFALILHCVKQATQETSSEAVEELTITQAKALADYFLNQAHIALGLFHRSPETELIKDTLAWMLTKGRETFTPRDLQIGRKRKFPKASKAEEILKLMADYGHGVWSEESRIFTLNPEAEAV
jgi:hypothetical protein